MKFTEIDRVKIFPMYSNHCWVRKKKPSISIMEESPKSRQNLKKKENNSKKKSKNKNKKNEERKR